MAISGCGVKVSLNDERTGGWAEIGLFASTAKASEKVRAACGIRDDDPYDPLANGPYLPAITHVVQAFACMESEKDAQ